MTSHSRTAPPRLEPLEPRDAPAISAALDDVVRFVGSAAGDTLTITEDSGFLRHDRFSAGDPGFASNFDFDSTQSDVQMVSATSSGAPLLIDLGDGNDTVDVAVPAAVAIVDVTRGTDTVTGADGFVTKTTLTYPDLDGDAVTLAVTKGTLSLGDFSFLPASQLPGPPAGSGLHVLEARIRPELGGTDITVTARPTAAGGDGSVDVTQIDAAGVDLGRVTVAGDLVSFFAGNPTTLGGVKSLTVRSLGVLAEFAPGGPSATVGVAGPLGALRVSGDIRNARLTVAGQATPAAGRIGSVTVGGSVLGLGVDHGGVIESAGDMGPVFIGGDLVGEGGDTAGVVRAGGKMGPVTVRGSVRGGPGGPNGVIRSGGAIGPVTIGGDLVGGPEADSGVIRADGNLGPVRIGGAILGGAGARSGVVRADGALARVAIGGSIRGGDGSFSGLVQSVGPVGPVTVGGDIVGGTADRSGSIRASADIASVRVGGSVIGGTTTLLERETGMIYAVNSRAAGIGPVSIGGNLVGGTGTIGGAVYARGNVAGVTVGGSVIGGSGETGGLIYSEAGRVGPVRIRGDLRGSGAFSSGSVVTLVGSIAGVTVGGSVIGGPGPEVSGVLSGERLGPVKIGGSLSGPPGTGLRISARGTFVIPFLMSPVGIASISVGGRVENALILAGYTGNGIPVNGDVRIGPVTVGGDWVASSLVSGVLDDGNGFGNPNDHSIPIGLPVIRSTIASVTIRGQAYGTFGGTDHFGFVAQEIGAFRVGGARLPLEPGWGNDVRELGITDDLTVREVV